MAEDPLCLREVKPTDVPLDVDRTSVLDIIQALHKLPGELLKHTTNCTEWVSIVPKDQCYKTGEHSFKLGIKGP